MTKEEFDFDTWFDHLSVNVFDQTGFEFRDQESVKEDYEAGRNLFDVAKEIAAEYID